MACLSTTLKYLVLLFNLLFFFLGCAIIGIGIYMQVKMAAYFDLLGNITINSATIFIILGCIVTIISFFGCCGACMESPCMMYTFGSLVALVLLIEVGLTVVVLIYQDETKSVISKAMMDGLVNYNKTDDKDNEYGGVTLAWDGMQESYYCCGVNDYSDWRNADIGKLTNSVPDSCCEVKTEGCGKNQLNLNTRIYTQGCFVKFGADVQNNLGIAGAVGGVLGAVQLIAIFFSCCLGRKMQNRRYDNYEHSPSAPLYTNY